MDPKTLPQFAVRSVAYSQWAYWCSIVVAALSVVYIPPGSVRTTVLLTPILTALLCLFVAYWLYEACDEYLRSRLRMCVAVTAIVVASCSLGYFFLELLGFPRLSMLWINLLGWSVFNLQVLYVIYRSR
jgi:hypothetical protein